MMTDPDPELVAFLARVGLEHEADALASCATFEIALSAAEERAPLGATRLGGTPDFPRGKAEWPMHSWPLTEVHAWPDFAQEELTEARDLGAVFDEGDRLMMPIPFLGQVNLAELNAYDSAKVLPATGLLLFFAATMTDIADPLFGKRVASAVIHVDSTDLESAPDRVVTDPHPQSVLFLQPERRLVLDLPWERLTELKARFPTDEQRRFVVDASKLGDAVLPAPAREAVGRMPPQGETAIFRVLEHDELEFFVGDASWVTFSIPDDALAERRFAAARASVFVG
ncbi:hypothetical protein BH09MYX1_BH09MYX1_22080 [soil metagenome]